MHDDDTDETESKTEPAESTSEDVPPTRSLSRRTALGLLGLGGLGVLGTQSASGQQAQRQWRTDVNANGHTLYNLDSLGMNNNTEITHFAGRNLSIDGRGVLHATDTRASVSDDGTELVSNVTQIDFGPNLRVDTDGSGGVVVTGAGSPWTDSDDDGLLEPGASTTGIDVEAVETDDLSVGNVGVSVELSEAQIVPSWTQEAVVAFDDEAFDDRNEFDTSEHEFVASTDGTYHVDVYLTVGEGAETSTLALKVRRFFDGAPGPSLASTSTRAQSVTSLSLSRTVRLNEGDALRVVFSNIATTAERTILPGEQAALSIHRVG